MSKVITFTTMHFIIAFAVTWALTGDAVVGGLVAMIEPAINSVGYVIHERVWAQASAGRQARTSREIKPTLVV